jgi:hypothetical protein
MSEAVTPTRIPQTIEWKWLGVVDRDRHSVSVRSYRTGDEKVKRGASI